jgi:hypothetical protein
MEDSNKLIIFLNRFIYFFRKLEARLKSSFNESGENSSMGSFGETVDIYTRLWKESVKIYKGFFTTGAKSSIEIQFPDLFTEIAAYVSVVNMESTSGYRYFFKAQDLIFQDLYDSVYRKFLHSESYFKWLSEIQKMNLEEDTDATDQSRSNAVNAEGRVPLWFDNLRMGGEHAVRAWLNTSEFESFSSSLDLSDTGPASRECRSSNVMNTLCDELEGIGEKSVKGRSCYCSRLLLEIEHFYH